MPTRTPITRRQFVKGTAGLAAAAAAAGFPTVISATALGNAQRAAPSERLQMGFIGVGKMGGSHLNSMVGKREIQINAICDVFAPRAEFAAKRVEKTYSDIERKDYKGCQVYEKHQDLLARDDIDAVLIAPPDHWHIAIALDACKAKKDIYCEKPLTLTIHEAKTIIDAVDKHKVVFQTGSQQRSDNPEFREVAELVRNGALGKLKEIHVGIGPSSVPCGLPGEEEPSGLNWDRWLGPAPQRPYHHQLCQKGMPDQYPFNPGWREYLEYSGGFVTDWGAHHYDIVQWALDKDNSGPVEITPPRNPLSQYGTRLLYRDTPAGAEVPVFHTEVVWDNPRETNGIRFVGEKGEVFVTRGRKRSNPESLVKEAPAGGVKLFKSPGHRENWMNCIKTREKPLASAEVGARTVTVCHLVNLAYWHDTKLQWDPQKWEFTGPSAAEANKWRSRERRQGYELPEV